MKVLNKKKIEKILIGIAISIIVILYSILLVMQAFNINTDL